MSVRRRFVCASGAFLLPQALVLVSVSVSAQSFNTAPEAEAAAALWLGGGGSYAASMRGSVDLHQDGSMEEIFSNPEIDFHFEAGVWGTGGNEPMAFAHAMMNLEPGPNATYLRPPPGPSTTWGGGYGRIPCNVATDIHCNCDLLDPTNCNRRTSPSAFISKPYRFVNTSGMTLPSTVTVVPVLVDYAVHLHTAVGKPLPGNPKLFALGGSVRLGYTTGGPTLYYVDCGAAGCETPEATTVALEGTFGADVQLAKAEDVVLTVEAKMGLFLTPECETVSTTLGDICVVPPYGGSASTLVDPYVYIDPAWPYASWFEVQTTSDDANTMWTTAKRTAIDPMAFGIEAEMEPTDGGVPDAGPDEDASVGMDAGLDGGADSGVPEANDGGGGCALGSGERIPPGHMAWLVVGVALARRRRRRADKRKGAMSDEC